MSPSCQLSIGMISNSPIIVNMSMQKELEIMYSHSEQNQEDDLPLYMQQMNELFNLAKK